MVGWFLELWGFWGFFFLLLGFLGFFFLSFLFTLLVVLFFSCSCFMAVGCVLFFCLFCRFFLLVFLSCLFCLDLVGVWILILSLLGGGLNGSWGFREGLLGLMSVRGPLGFFFFLFLFVFVFNVLLLFLSVFFYPPKTNKKEKGNKE